MTPIANRVLRSMVHGHVLLAFAAALQLAWVGDLFHWQVGVGTLWFAGLLTFSAYGAMRLLRMDSPGAAGSDVMCWYRDHRRAMVVLVVLAGIAALALGWSIGGAVVSVLWLPAIIAATYTLPLGVSKGNPIGLRRLPLLKGFLIAYVWTVLVVVLPNRLASHELPGPSPWWFASIWFCYFLALTVAFDVRDLPYDLPSLRTLPQVFGPRMAKLLAVLLLVPLGVFLCAALLVGRIAAGGDYDASLLLPLAGLVATAGVVAFARPSRPWWYYPVLVDGSMVLLPLLSWLGGLY
jgi:hypothetical protein